MKKLAITLSLVGILFFTGCRKEQSTGSHEEAARLYAKICKATALYTDSILHAKDTTTLYALLERFEDRLEAINYEALPDTDYNLTEGENDTISMALDSLISARIRRLRELGERKALAIDSVSADSSVIK